MGNYIKVSVPKMKEDADKLQDCYDKVPKLIKDLENVMARLGTCWEGPAWVSFQKQMRIDIANMLDVYDWMKVFIESMTKAEEVYGNCEEQMYQTIEGVRV